MAVPNSRATLISYCKRRLGSGMIDINITADQEGDVIDDNGEDRCNFFLFFLS